MNLTMITRGKTKAIKYSSFISDDHNLFTSSNFDDLLNSWDHQHTVSINNWSHFPRRSSISQGDTSLNLLDEIKQIVDEHYKHTTLTRISDQLKNT